MQIHYITEAVWPSIEVSVEHLSTLRPGPEKTKLLAGLNYQIILGSACFLEGVLESLLRAILDHRMWVFFESDQPVFEKRKANNNFFNRIVEDLSGRVGRSTGVSGYNDMFELLTGNGISELAKVKPLLEGITVLFHFRNVLGHGREVSATQFSSQKEEFNGSYRKVEDYLLKTNLLKHRFVDVQSEYLFLGSEIADHFWNLAKAVPEAIVNSLSAPEAEVCSKVLIEQRMEAPSMP